MSENTKVSGTVICRIGKIQRGKYKGVENTKVSGTVICRIDARNGDPPDGDVHGERILLLVFSRECLFRFAGDDEGEFLTRNYGLVSQNEERELDFEFPFFV